jgi:hypothetical protein
MSDLQDLHRRASRAPIYLRRAIALRGLQDELRSLCRYYFLLDSTSGRSTLLVASRGCPMRVAIPDDIHHAYEGTPGVSRLRARAEVEIFTESCREPNALKNFDALVANRERTRFSRAVLKQLPDEALLATAREAMRKSKAWAEISGDKRLQDQLPQGQMRDAEARAKSNREGAAKAVRNAWSHILYPVKSDATAAGVAFELERSPNTSKDRSAIPVGVYDKIGPKGDGTIKEKLGPDTFSLQLKPLWPQDRPHLSVNEIAEWFCTYVYLPKLRDRVVLDTAIRDAVRNTAPSFGYADSFDEASGTYVGLIWAKIPPELMPSTAVLVRSDVALEQLKPSAVGVAINALLSIIASSASMLPEVMHTLNAGNGTTISFVSETDVPTIVVSQADASRYSSAAVELDRRLQALIEEVSSGS